MKKISVFLLVIGMLISVSIGSAQDSGREVITPDNAGQLQELIRLGRGSADFVAWSPDGANILVGGSLGVWQYDATALDTMSEPTLINAGGEIDHFAVSPDGNTIAVIHSDGDGVEFRDYATGTVNGLYDPEVFEEQLAYSPDGAYLSINGGSNGLEIVDTANNSLFISAEGSLDSGVPVQFSPDSAYIAAATRSYNIAIWNLSAGGEPLELEGHTSTINDFTYSPDGALIATASSDDSVRLFNATDGTQIAMITNVDADTTIRDAYAVAFSPDGSQLYTGHGAGMVRVWDVAAGATEEGIGTQLTTIEFVEEGSVGTIEDIVFSPDGSQFVVLHDHMPAAVNLLNADNTVVANTVGHNAYVYAAEFSPSSDTLSFSDGESILYLWDTAAAEEITFNISVMDGPTTGISNLNNITYTSDGEYMATLQSFSATLRDPATGAVIREFEADGISEDIAFSPDNTLIALISSQGTYVFDVATGQLLVSLLENNDWMQGVVWSSDQTMLATVSGDHAVRVYTIGG